MDLIIGKYKISPETNKCSNSRARLMWCKHTFTNTETQETGLYDCRDICYFLKRDNLSHPHFDTYITHYEYCRRRYDPTLEEKEKKIEENLKRITQEEEIKQQRVIIDEHKTSTYIERKKQKALKDTL